MLQRHIPRRNDPQGDGPFTVHPAYGFGVDGLPHLGHGAQRHHAAPGGVKQDVVHILRPAHDAVGGIQKHVDLLVAQKELIHEGAVGKGPDGVTQVASVYAQLIGPFPVGTDLHKRLSQGKAGRLQTHLGVVEHGLRLDKGLKAGVEQGNKIGPAQFQVDASGAAHVAGENGAARGKGVNAGDFADLRHDDVQQVVHLGDGGRFRNHHVAGAAGVAHHIVQARHFGLAPGVFLRVLADIRHQVIIQPLVDLVHLVDVVARRRVHLYKELLLLSFWKVFRLGHGGEDGEDDAHHQGREGQPAPQPLHQPAHETQDGGPCRPARRPQAKTASGLVRVQVEKAAAQGRHRRGRHQQGHQYGGRYGHGDVRIELPGFFLDEDDRDENQHRGQGGS